METKTIFEQPLLSYKGCCPQFGQKIEVYAEDLKNAKVGDSWSCEDQDRYPNRTTTWDVSYTVVYKDEHGVLVLFRDEDSEYYGPKDDVKLIWVELH